MWVLSVRNVIALLFLTLIFTTAVITLSQKSSIARKASEEVDLGVKAAVKTIPLSTNRSMAEYTNRPSKHKTENLMLQRLYQTHELLNQIYKTTEFTTQPNLRGRLLSSQRNIPQELQPAPLSTTFTEKCSLIIPKDKKIFYSQSQEDLGLFLKLFHKPLRCGGTMLEMGALDGVLYSNSKFFEDALGWRTILLEANPNNAKRMFLNRPKAVKYHNAACPGRGNYINYISESNDTMSSVGGDINSMSAYHKKRFGIRTENTVRVPCITLKEVFEQHNIRHLDIVSLDVEGAELVVLETMDWNVTVDHWLIELDGSNPTKDHAVIQFMERHGYILSWNQMSYCFPYLLRRLQTKGKAKTKAYISRLLVSPLPESMTCMKNGIFERADMVRHRRMYPEGPEDLGIDSNN